MTNKCDKTTACEFYAGLKALSNKESRDKKIREALRYRGLSVIIRTEAEFLHMKRFLGEDVLWMDFVPQMAAKPTAIVIWSDLESYSPGSVGCAESQKEDFIRLAEFNDFFKI
jgi:hypothetical protein